MTYPQAIDALKEHLGDSFSQKDWDAPLDAVMAAGEDGDVFQALEAVNKLATASSRPKLTIRIPARPPQTVQVESELQESVNTLRARNRIHGEPLSIDEIIEPAAEKEDPTGLDTTVELDDQALENLIIEHIQDEERATSSTGEAMEVDDSDDELDNGPDISKVSRREVMDLCAKLEQLAVSFGGDEHGLALCEHLRKFRGQMAREELLNSSQTYIDSYFKPSTSTR
jgi:hypothetical protein